MLSKQNFAQCTMKSRRGKFESEQTSTVLKAEDVFRLSVQNKTVTVHSFYTVFTFEWAKGTLSVGVFNSPFPL